MYKHLTYIGFMFILGCHGIERKPKQLDSPAPADQNVAELFVQAYNQHDVAGMLQWVHADIRYMYISNDSLYKETSGKPALAEFLPPFFANKPHAKSELLSSTQSGSFVHQVERALWQNAEGHIKSQCSLSVYQLQDQLIINIWYFDVFKCPKD